MLLVLPARTLRRAGCVATNWHEYAGRVKAREFACGSMVKIW